MTPEAATKARAILLVMRREIQEARDELRQLRGELLQMKGSLGEERRSENERAN